MQSIYSSHEIIISKSNDSCLPADNYNIHCHIANNTFLKEQTASNLIAMTFFDEKTLKNCLNDKIPIRLIGFLKTLYILK